MADISDGGPPRHGGPPGDAELQVRQIVRGARPGDQYVRLTHHPSFRRLHSGVLTTRPGVGQPRSLPGRLLTALARLVFGSPIPSAAELTERVGIVRGLAVFATDNISSSAYATEEIMRVLVLAGVGTLALTMPITLGIVIVLAIVVISYLQVISAYPNGGGSYIVAYENLGPMAGLVAGSALLTDYILTVAVSVSAGVAALTSAFPEWHDHRVAIALVVVAALTIVNLRGVREVGAFFALPAFLYIAAIYGLIGYGLFRVATGQAPESPSPAEWLGVHEYHPLTLLLLLRAFSSGSVALTGTEAVSNGVPSFQPPEVRNARIALVIMGTLFGSIFVGLSFLAGAIGVHPDPFEVQTVVSQIARSLVGEGWYFYLLQAATAVLLLLAANTAFNGFPRLASVLAEHRYLPRQLSFRGDRLAFTGGIVVLALAAGFLIWAYQGSTTGLIPLYTVGVFLAFTLSQAGLVRRWWTQRGSGWRVRLGMNGVGTVATSVVMVVVAVSKFLLGAWMVLVFLPVLVWMMWGIRTHYRRWESSSKPETPVDPSAVRVRAIVPVATLSVPVRQAAAFATAVADDDQAVAVHVTDDEAAAARFQEEWRREMPDVPLVIVESPYRSLIAPLLAYIDAVRETHPDDTLMVILPEYVGSHWWEALLHNHTALRLKAALLLHPGIVVASVPYHVSA